MQEFDVCDKYSKCREVQRHVKGLPALTYSPGFASTFQ